MSTPLTSKSTNSTNGFLFIDPSPYKISVPDLRTEKGGGEPERSLLRRRNVPTPGTRTYLPVTDLVRTSGTRFTGDDR